MVDLGEIQVLVGKIAENLEDSVHTLVAPFQVFQVPAEVEGIHQSGSLRLITQK
jgi:hypothetical protein